MLPTCWPDKRPPNSISKNGQELVSFLYLCCRFNPVQMQVIEATTPLRAPPPKPWVIFPPVSVVRQFNYEDERAGVPKKSFFGTSHLFCT